MFAIQSVHSEINCISIGDEMRWVDVCNFVHCTESFYYCNAFGCPVKGNGHGLQVHLRIQFACIRLRTNEFDGMLIGENSAEIQLIWNHKTITHGICDSFMYPFSSNLWVQITRTYFDVGWSVDCGPTVHSLMQQILSLIIAYLFIASNLKPIEASICVCVQCAVHLVASWSSAFN